MKKLLIVSFWLWGQVGWSQTFTASASLPKVNQNGFYRIPLSPALVSQMNEGFTNLRIYDSLQQEVPYLMKTEIPVFASRKFVEYPVVEKKSKEHFTQIIFGNKQKRSINNVTLVIKNAETTKEASLLGSDDRNSWYALKENFFLTSIQSINQTYEMRIVDFPLSNYSYFKLKVNDSTTAPLNILNVGYYDADEVTGNYTILPDTHLTVEDNQSTKKTTLKILFDAMILVDKLEFEIIGPALYNRTATVQRPMIFITRRRKEVKRNEYVQTVRFISTQQASFHLPSVFTKEISFEIDNEDNPPLQIVSVKAYQLNRYLITWLVKGKTYGIKTGKQDMPAPSYDIGYFKDSIPNDPPTVRPGTLVVVQPKIAAQKPNWFSDKRFIWAAIVLVAAFLGFMSYNMVKEAK